jgi:CheY-like chemotaxis protein
MSPRTILVVDDSPTERWFLCDLLARGGRRWYCSTW